jgi:hypothetical protein
MMNNQNSRRNFLSSIAILSAGTVIAGSPAKLFSSGEDETMNPEEAWKTYMKNAGASVCLNVAGLELPVTSTEVKGHLVKRGRIVSFEKENLLAQPAWIYWGSNTTKPADVLINVYENKYPYKRLTTINRYELNALAQVSKKNAGENLLLASCVKNNIENKQLRRLRIHTKINKRKLSQDISFYKNDSIILKEQLFYSA